MAFIIALVTSKGGAGKTTAAVAIASELERRNRNVALIDGDPNAHLTRWHKLNVEAVGDHGRRIYGGLTDSNILSTINTARDGMDYVVFDNEGVATHKTTFVFGRASLVIIPMRFSELDLVETRRTLAAIENTAAVLDRSVPHAVLLTQTPPLRSKIEAHILNELRDMGIEVFRRRLAERVVWREVMNHGETDLPSFKTKGASDAHADISAIVDEIEERAANPERNSDERAAA
jgi:chromosome partitioning protein